MSNRVNKWQNGLRRTRKSTFGRIASILGVTEITPSTWDDLETLLIQSDIGVDLAQEIIQELKDRSKLSGIRKSSDLLELVNNILSSKIIVPPFVAFESTPSIIMVVGVNGSGKTTTIAKLGQRYKTAGKSVLFGATDTFRAAGVEQLKSWGDKLNIPVISGIAGGDPGAVAYDTVNSAISRNVDIGLIDTAGRLHTRYNLMEELKKIHRVIGKAMAGAPHHVWMVLDSTTGQNGLKQAEAFLEAVDLTGIVMAKLDSSARGGIAFAIQKKLGVPILFAGLGEKEEDLIPFDKQLFLNGILNDIQLS